MIRLSSVPVLLHTDLLRSWPYAKLLPQRVHVGGEGLDTFFDYCDPVRLKFDSPFAMIELLVQNWNMIHTPNITSARQMDHWLGDNPSQHSYSALYRFSNNPDVDCEFAIGGRTAGAIVVISNLNVLASLGALFYNTSFSHVIPMSINMLLECQLRAKAPHHRARFRIRWEIASCSAWSGFSIYLYSSCFIRVGIIPFQDALSTRTLLCKGWLLYGLQSVFL